MSDTQPSTPILPAHIEETVRAIADLHADHHRRSTGVQRFVDRLTGLIGQPGSVAVITVVVVVWVAANLLAPTLKLEPFDLPPFPWMATAAAIVALYVTVMILSTQRRENELSQLREHLTLELAILSEQKTAKTIALLEEMRRDNPLLRNRVDEEAEAMSQPADPSSVLEAIRETHAEAETNLGAPDADEEAAELT